MIVTLLEVAGSLPRTRALRLNRGNTHMGSERSLHMEVCSLPVLRHSSSEGLAPDAPPHPAAEGMESPTGSTVGLSGAVFSKPTRNRSPSVLLPL